MHRLPTEMLILKYCESLAEDQSTEGVSADLSLSVAYVADQVELSVVENNIPLTKTRGRVTNDPGVFETSPLHASVHESCMHLCTCACVYVCMYA